MIFKRKMIVIITCMILLLSAVTIYASSADPGSVSDPLVSKSYVDMRINEILSSVGQSGQTNNNTDTSPTENTMSTGEIYKLINDLVDLKLKDALKNMETTEGTSTEKETEIKPESNPQEIFTAVGPIESGTAVICGQGAELILRSGKAMALGKNGNGLQDITDGVDLKTGENIPLYHMLLFPRDDGRGIVIEDEAYIMIKGKYELK